MDFWTSAHPEMWEGLRFLRNYLMTIFPKVHGHSKTAPSCGWWTSKAHISALQQLHDKNKIYNTVECVACIRRHKMLHRINVEVRFSNMCLLHIITMKFPVFNFVRLLIRLIWVCVRPAMDWWLGQGVPPLFLYNSSSKFATLSWKKKLPIIYSYKVQ